MPRRARLLRKPFSEFTSWSQLLKKSGSQRFRRKWQVYKPIIELSTSNKTGKPESTVENQAISLKCPAQGHDECNRDVSSTNLRLATMITVSFRIASLVRQHALGRQRESRGTLLHASTLPHTNSDPASAIPRLCGRRDSLCDRAYRLL